MESKRATVMLLHGSGEDRLRQAIAEGLVSKDVQKEIDSVIAEASEARETANAIQRQLDGERAHIAELNARIGNMQQKMRQDAERYNKAIQALRREEQRVEEKAERKDAYIMALFGAANFILSNLIGHFIFGFLFK